jgi:glycosyltransferase involved in cell wall biosynthesis
VGGPIITVVIPAYKAEAWIGETLESVFRQTYPASDLEILVVDDASPDESARIAQKLLTERSARGRVISCERNGGVSAARNVGWRAAAGEWVQFLDADDLLAPRKLELQAAFARELPPESAVVYSDWQHFAQTGGQWKPTGPLMSPLVDENTVMRMLLDPHYGYVGPHLVRASALRGVAGFDETMRLGEDSDLMLRIALAGGRFHKLAAPEPLFFYRDTPNSLWRQCAGDVDSLRKLNAVWRRGELFLRAQNGGDLPENLRQELVSRYSRDLALVWEKDRPSFNQTMDWIRALGLPPRLGGGRALRALALVLGYEGAHELRFTYRRWKRGFLSR